MGIPINPDHFEIAARYLEQGFCKGSFARDEVGNDVSVYSPKACQWCAEAGLLLALNKEGDEHLDVEFSAYIELMSEAIEQYVPFWARNMLENPLSDFNDSPGITQHTMTEWLRITGEYAREQGYGDYVQ